MEEERDSSLLLGSRALRAQTMHALSPLLPIRNEGIDMTHNPEFTTCEFYQVRADPLSHTSCCSR